MIKYQYGAEITSENNKADFAVAKSALLKIRKSDPSDVTH
jgi:hypothetical protein